MFIRFFLVLSVCTFSQFAIAQAHQHGVGKAFIAQENDQWLINLVLPASDILGFEHQPTTESELLALDNYTKKSQLNNELVKLVGECKLSSIELITPFDSAKHQHKEHDHAHDHKHEHDKKNAHADLELNFLYSCTSVTRIEFPILSNYQQLSSIEVIWATDKGQGASEVSSPTQQITW